MPSSTPSEGVVAAGRYLHNLLAARPEYRRRWAMHAKRIRSGDVSYAAISQVVALFLWDEGLKPDTDRDLPRRLRDRIRQALLGEQLGHETLTWLAGAFDFDAEDTRQVWSLFAGKNAIDIEGEGIAFTLRHPAIPIVLPQRHRTIALFSRYFVGSDRSLYRVETSHVIAALEDRVTSFGYSPPDTVEEVTVDSGGRLVGLHASDPGFVGVEIELRPALMRGHHSSLQYSTTHRPEAQPSTEVRRAARKRIENVDLRVIFEGRQPLRSWWCQWDEYAGGEPSQEIAVEPSSTAELHQFVPYLEQAVVGFRWEW
ncbi:hypothetical protein AB0P21_07600 [Kribbella sp. NPDC056861]|uniref:hypothetical protein n=1 Tax=Kribbella sp. NPDC056861 TaxID=3154857 RepID=UPI00341788C8